MSEAMSKEQLLREFADAYEEVIRKATEAARSGTTTIRDGWGPREIVAHLAGWEVMATVRIPAIAAGMAPLEFDDDIQQTVMNDAINATIVTMIGDQPLETVCGILRQAYQRDSVLLKTLGERYFQPGEYVYERTRSAIEHCQEHGEEIMPSYPKMGELQ